MTAGTHRAQVAKPAGGQLFGLLYVVFGLLAFAVQDTIVKALSSHYPVLELLTVRSVVVLVGLVLLMMLVEKSESRWSLFKTRTPLLLMSRGVFAFFAFTAYYLALAQIPLADAAAVYMTAPLFVTALSVPLLSEKVGRHRVLAVVVGFLAAIMMIQPGSSVFQAAAVLPLFSAMAYAFIPIINRRVGLSQPALTMAFYTILCYLVLCVIAFLLVHAESWPVNPDSVFANLVNRWRPMSPEHILWCAVSGLFFIGGLLGLTQSYRLLPVSIVAPFEYSYLIWATVLGWLVFRESPGVHTITGGVVVVACGCYITYREHRLNQSS